MQQSIVKRKLAAGEPVLTMKVNYQSPDICELIGLMGFDCIWICNEHLGMDPSTIDALIRGCRASGIDAMIRTKPGDYRDLLHPLEMGAKGIMLPRSRNADEVRQVIRDMKFYPLGRRGVDGVNAEADFGLTPLVDYLKLANQENFLMVQIEDPEAVEHIEEITEVEGVDVVFVGPGDLSVNLGIPGQTTHPDVMKVCERVVKACEKSGKAAGMTCGGKFTERAKELIDMGFKFIAAGSDYGMVLNGLKQLREDALSLGFPLQPMYSHSH